MSRCLLSVRDDKKEVVCVSACRSVYVHGVNLCLCVCFVDIDCIGWVGRSGKCSSLKFKLGKQDLGVLWADLTRQVQG